MFDKKMYIETFSALHAADNTLDQIYQAAAQKRSPNPSRIRHALIRAAMLVLMASSAVVAAGRPDHEYFFRQCSGSRECQRNAGRSPLGGFGDWYLLRHYCRPGRTPGSL